MNDNQFSAFTAVDDRFQQRNLTVDTDLIFRQTAENTSLSDFTQTGLEITAVDPLNGGRSLKLEHDSVTTKSFKQQFTIAPKFRGDRIFAVALVVSSEADPGNVTLKITDETGSPVDIIASEQIITDEDELTFVTSFRVPATCTELSYTIQALPQSGSPVTLIDDIVFRESTSSLLSTSVEVPADTEWESYTPTFQGLGTVTDISYEWRQVGEDIEIRGKHTTGTNTAVEARIGLPSGFTSSGTDKIPSIKLAGVLVYANNGASSGYVLIEPSATYMTLSYQSSGSAGLVKQLGSGFTNGQTQSIFAKFPCAGLTATKTKTIPLTQSSFIQEADSELKVYGYAGYGSTATRVLRFTTLQTADGDAVQYIADAVNGDRFVALKDGFYGITAYLGNSAASAARAQIAISKNATQLTTDAVSMPQTDVFLKVMQDNSVHAEVSTGSWSGPLKAGDIIRLHGDGNAPDTSYLGFSMTFAGKLKQVNVNPNSKIALPTSEVRFEGASSRGAVDVAIVRFDNIAKVRGDAFSIVNNANNGTVITVQKAGTLTVNVSLVANASPSGMFITRNLTNLTVSPTVASEILSAETGSASSSTSTSWKGDVAIGDVIRIATGNNPIAFAGNMLTLHHEEKEVAVAINNIQPQWSEEDAIVRVYGWNGFGAVNTAVVRFSSVDLNLGGKVSFTDDANLGSSFLIQEDGIYNLSCVATSNVNNDVAGFSIVKNITTSAAPSTLNCLAIIYDRSPTGTNERYLTGSVETKLLKGDVVRVTSASTILNGNNGIQFTITKVGKPNITAVDVTPFVQIPQPQKQNLVLANSPGFGSTNTLVRRFTNIQYSSGKDILRYEDSATLGASFTALKNCYVTFGYSEDGGITGQSLFNVVKNATTYTNVINTSSVEPGSGRHTVSGSIYLAAGEVLRPVVEIPARHVTSSSIVRFSITAEATSDQILTENEVISSDTLPFKFANSSEYNISTLPSSPIGTYITYTTGLNTTNVHTQTTGTNRPTQTDADMNTSGIRLFSRPYNAASLSGNPAYIAINIGKGLKGVRVFGYVGSAKSGNKVKPDQHAAYGTGSEIGAECLYDELTGIMLLDAATVWSSTITSRYWIDQTGNAQTSIYIVINASKNPALSGLNTFRSVAARGVSSTGQSIPNSGFHVVTYNAVKEYDTHGALNAATGVFTAPESGYYQASACSYFATATYAVGNSTYGTFFKNGVLTVVGNITYTDAAGSRDRTCPVSTGIYLNKGDTLDYRITNVRTAGATSLFAGTAFNYFSVHKT